MSASRPPLTRHTAIALLLTATALVLTFTTPLLGRPYIAPFGALTLTAWLAGFPAAVLTLTVSLIVIGGYHLLSDGPSMLVFQGLPFAILGMLVASFARWREQSEHELRRHSAHLEGVIDQLRASETRYRTLVDASTAIVWAANARGEFAPPQESWEATTGQSFEKYEGWGWQDAIHPGDRARIDASWRHALSTGEPVNEITRIWNAPRADYRWYSARAVPRRDATGAIAEWVGACTDIHERQLAQAHLEESEERARLALEIARLGTWRWTPADNRIAADDRCAEICGILPGGVPLVDFEARVHPDDWPRLRTALAEAVTARTAFVEELRFVHADGSIRWALWRGRGFVRGSGGPGVADVVLGSALDVTSRKSIEDALRQADRQKDDFLALLAHELRNPLAPIRTAVQILKARGAADQDVARLHAVLERQVQHLVRMVDDLLDVSRVLRGKVELRSEVVVLADVLNSAVETSRPLIDAQEQQLEIDLPADPVRLHGDPVRLAQIVSNLLNNASKYSAVGARIWLSGSVTAGTVVIRVRDEGAGIPAEILPSVFEPFVQADRTLARSHSGLGIGLSLVKKLVELHGGTVTATSHGAGHGSEFVLCLPEAPAGTAPRRLAPEVDRAGSARALRLLVVDDNVDAADSLAMLLRLKGYEVHVAHNGPEALQLCADLQPAAVVLDIGLPGMSGYEVAAEIHRGPAAPPFLVALTGYGQQSDVDRAAAAGFDVHLVKPVDIAALLATLDGVTAPARPGPPTARTASPTRP
jgi:PAS domain S-box-containing protein